MKVILKKDFDTLGKAGDIIEVKQGYARNFLIPSKVAIAATPSNLQSFKEERKLLEKRELKGKKEAELLAAKLDKVSLTATVQVGEEDKVFGSVTNQNIADMLKDQGYEIDRKKIQLDEPLKALGVYDIPIKLHHEVEAKVKVWVVRD
ncbi:MAG TPA: 50S ribosomal protein L9 [bacterium]|nr:50S ribosomal protein L9 [bacterium]HPN44872.1 50S ribosomal protein L9 [bacterium]